MGKVLTLLLLLLLTLGSLTGYLLLTKKIISGQLKITAGEKQLEEGEEMLAKGKARLANGERELATGKDIHNKLKTASFLGVLSIFPVGAAVVAMTGDKVTGGEKIAEGDQLVAKGKEKVKNGEAQLKTGKLELQQGIAKLNRAKGVRLACAIGTLVFSCILILLGIIWRQAFFNFFKLHK